MLNITLIFDSYQRKSVRHLGLTPPDTQRRVTVMTVISLIDLGHDRFQRALQSFQCKQLDVGQMVGGVTPSPLRPDLSFLRHRVQRIAVAQSCEGRSPRVHLR